MRCRFIVIVAILIMAAGIGFASGSEIQNDENISDPIESMNDRDRAKVSYAYDSPAHANFVKVVNAAPEKEWDKTFGESGRRIAYSVQQTSDGGYIMVGHVESDAIFDTSLVWLVKTDSSGNKVWDKAFDRTVRDEAYSVQQTLDGGYIIAGHTYYDIWLVKTDSTGTKTWDKTFGGSGYDSAKSVQQTSDGGYIIAGYTYSYGAGDYDFWLVKTDSSGNKMWDKTFGGTDSDKAYSVQHTSDGGYIIAGDTSSYGAGDSDFWLVKTDSSGNKMWDKTFGGTGSDSAYSVQHTSDGGYIIAGDTSSYGAGDSDFWLVKTDSSGNKIWDKTFGGSGYDSAKSVQQTSGGGYIIAGSTWSYGAGDCDFWLVKTDSSGNKMWDKTFGRTCPDKAYSVQQTSDGGYIMAGSTYLSELDLFKFWLVKTSSDVCDNYNSIGVYRSGVFYLRNSNTAGTADLAFGYGMAGDIPVAGDWSGDSTDTIGIYRSGVFYLRNSNTAGTADLAFGYGMAGDIPVAGDWNGDGTETIGIYRNGVFYLRNSNTAGTADLTFGYGMAGDIPVAGDWSCDGTDTIGIYRSGVFYLRNSNTAGIADLAFGYGMAGDIPVAGDWDGNGVDTIGIYRSGVFYLRNSNTAGIADLAFGYGMAGDIPVIGDWDGILES